MVSTQFKLQPSEWYACEIIGDEFAEDCCSYSPIRVDRINPLKRGNQTFDLYFYHANYPEGVRNKKYRLRMIEHGHRYILAKSIDHNPSRVLHIYDIDIAWIERHFANRHIDQVDVQTWLDKREFSSG